MPNYVPMLRWKRGERTGLQHVRPTTKSASVTPYFDLAEDRFRGKDATKRAPATAAPDQFVADVLQAWGTGPCFVSAATLAPTSSSRHPIQDIAIKARAAKIAMIPATELSVSPVYQSGVVAAEKTLASGVCLKVNLDEMTSAATWTKSWHWPLSETDLIVDLGSDVANVLALGSSVIDAFRNLYKGSQWRSVTCAGSSMPANFSALAKGLHEIPRKEWQLWKKLAAGSLPFQIDYGDYATVALTTPPAGIRWGYPISVRYTLDDAFLVCRGVTTTRAGAEDLDVQLKKHAKSIVAYTTRKPLAGCWGDQRIDQIASGSINPGSLENWVSIGVNRHIELIRNRLP